MQLPSTVRPVKRRTTPGTVVQEPFDGLRFDYAAAATASWLIGGLYLDGWAHLHVPELETFFTPWHGVLYAGFLAFVVLLVGVTLWNQRQTRAWARSIPRGYELAALGVGLFATGGIGDMIWHILFGVESDVEALLSPTHLVLAVGAGFMVTGPLRAAWQRHSTTTWATWIPVLLSVLTLLSLFTFFTSYIHPFIRTSAAEMFRPIEHEGKHANLDTGIAAVLLQTAVLMSIVLLLVRRWQNQIPFGTFTFLLGVNTVLVTAVFDQGRALDAWPLVVAAALSGLVGDTVLHLLRPSPERSLQLRIFAAILPITLFGLYFGVLVITSGMWWTVHIWTGTVAMAGITGWLLSIVVVPAPPSLVSSENTGPVKLGQLE